MKHSKTTLICLFSILFSGMLSCTKTTDIEPNGSIDRKLSGSKPEVSVGLIMSGPEVLVGESAYFEPFIFVANGEVAFDGCGKLILQKLNAQSNKWEDVNN